MTEIFYLQDFKKVAFNCKFYNFKYLSFRCALSIYFKTAKQSEANLFPQTLKKPSLLDFTKCNIKKHYDKHFRLLKLNFRNLINFFSINAICDSLIYDNENKLTTQF